jgi:alpha,alpha-trehalase
MVREHAWWHQGEQTIKQKPPAGHAEASEHSVRLPDGRFYPRYFQQGAQPREESWLYDIQSGIDTPEKATEVLTSAESGWDHSTANMADGKTVKTLEPSKLIQPDLAARLVHAEEVIAQSYKLQANLAHGKANRYEKLHLERAANKYYAVAQEMRNKQNEFTKLAKVNSQNIRDLLWNGKVGAFTAYHWEKGALKDDITANTYYPLIYGIATAEQAAAVAETTKSELLKPGGIIATTKETMEGQWNSPFAWAPFNKAAVEGLKRYGYHDLARLAAVSYLRANLAFYKKHGVLMEKINAVQEPGADLNEPQHGEYANQVGFGWTNGYLLDLYEQYPEEAQAAEKEFNLPSSFGAPSKSI